MVREERRDRPLGDPVSVDVKARDLSPTGSPERGFAAPKTVPDEIAKKLEAAIADGLRDPEFIKSSPGDAPVIAFMPGAEWQKRLDDMSQALRPLAEEMKAQEQK